MISSFLFYYLAFLGLHALAYWPVFPHLLQFDSSAVPLCMGHQFGALQNLHGRYPIFPVFMLFGLVLNHSILCIGSSFIFCRSFVVISASGIVFFSFSIVFFLFVLNFLARSYQEIQENSRFLSRVARGFTLGITYVVKVQEFLTSFSRAFLSPNNLP